MNTGKLPEMLMAAVVVVALVLWLGAVVIAGLQVDSLTSSSCTITTAHNVSTLSATCREMPALFNVVGNTLGTAFTSALGALLGVSIAYGGTGQKLMGSASDTVAFRVAGVCVSVFLTGLVVAAIFAGIRMFTHPQIERGLPTIISSSVTTLLGISSAVIAAVVARK